MRVSWLHLTSRKKDKAAKPQAPDHWHTSLACKAEMWLNSANLFLDSSSKYAWVEKFHSCAGLNAKALHSTFLIVYFISAERNELVFSLKTLVANKVLILLRRLTLEAALLFKWQQNTLMNFKVFCFFHVAHSMSYIFQLCLYQFFFMWDMKENKVWQKHNILFVSSEI